MNGLLIYIVGALWAAGCIALAALLLAVLIEGAHRLWLRREERQR
ncbi:hypothetical protein ACIF6L_26470 [Kitasatospora sp. NPDC086009]